MDFHYSTTRNRTHTKTDSHTILVEDFFQIVTNGFLRDFSKTIDLLIRPTIYDQLLRLKLKKNKEKKSITMEPHLSTVDRKHNKQTVDQARKSRTRACN